MALHLSLLRAKVKERFGLKKRAANRLIGDVVCAYTDWREECREVWAANERWSDASGADAGLAFAAYRAALDREQQAAAEYADLWARVTRLAGIPDPEPTPAVAAGAPREA